jgi:citrate/tricarballylate utilization protein
MRALWGAVAEGRFYAVFPHGLMVGLFAPVFGFSVGALGIGVARFWRGVAGGEPHAAAIGEAAHDALRLKYLDGGHGEGCPNDDDRFTLARRRFHHFTMYGFLLCFAATVVATLYHYGLGQPAPYAWTSAPKVLGTLGGTGLVIGTVGLWWLRQRRDPDLIEPTQRAMDEGFIALLFLTGASGLALALARTTPAMPLLLCLHLASVLAFFATMPYGKFAHGVYRGAALLKWAVERRRPNRLRLGSE